jgi:hypothetical protein
MVDMEIIYAVFASMMITAGAGKIVAFHSFAYNNIPPSILFSGFFM